MRTRFAAARRGSRAGAARRRPVSLPVHRLRLPPVAAVAALPVRLPPSLQPAPQRRSCSRAAARAPAPAPGRPCGPAPPVRADVASRAAPSRLPVAALAAAASGLLCSAAGSCAAARAPPSSAPRLAAVYCRPCCSAGCRAPPRRPSPLHFSKQAPGLYLLSREGTFIHILLGMCPLLLLVLAGASWCWTFLPFQLAWPSLQISLHLYFGLLLSTVIFCLLLLLLPAASTLACCFC